MSNSVRQFETGATRSADNGKPDYEGYLSPTVIDAFGKYMTAHRTLPDGTTRASDNWMKGIPRDQYIKSLFRHFIDLWKIHRGVPAHDHTGKKVTIEDTLSALLFNTQGYFHEHLKAIDARCQAAANRVGGEVSDVSGRSFFPDAGTPAKDLEETTAFDPHAGGGTTRATPGVPYGEHYRASMINKLVEIGCPEPVAVLIAKGTTFAPLSMGPLCFVYVAGPMRGIKNFNFPEFDRVRDYMLTQGYSVISPADIDRADTDGADPANRQTEYAFRDFQALHFLKAFNPTGKSGIVLLPGWEKSTGAAGEFFMGRWLNLAFYRVVGNDNCRNAYPGRLMACVAADLLHTFALANAKA